MNITALVKETIERYRLLKTGDVVVVAVSGGPDSVALVHILNDLRYDFGIRIHIAHLNHKLRRTAGKDQEFVRKLAARLGLTYTTASVNVRKEKSGSSLEEKAREARLRFLIQTAKKYKAHIIALGHTQDDLAETVLMRIIRGAGLCGMRAMMPKRKIKGVTIIRPLLEIRKKDLGQFLKQRHCKFCTDSTNRQTEFFRNKIRLGLLPVLEKTYNKNISKLLANLARTVAIDYDCLHSEAENAFAKLNKKQNGKTGVRFSVSEFSKYHPSIRRILLRLAIRKIKGNTNRIAFSHIKDMEALINLRPSGTTIHLPSRITVSKKNRYVVIRRRNS